MPPSAVLSYFFGSAILNIPVTGSSFQNKLLNEPKFDGNSLVVNVCFFSPPVSPNTSNSVCVLSFPTATLPLRFGKLKVVLPSPTPNVVPIMLNNNEYVVLLIALPSHNSQFSGTVSLANGTIEPTGNVSPLTCAFIAASILSCI